MGIFMYANVSWYRLWRKPPNIWNTDFRVDCCGKTVVWFSCRSSSRYPTSRKLCLPEMYRNVPEWAKDCKLSDPYQTRRTSRLVSRTVRATITQRVSSRTSRRPELWSKRHNYFRNQNLATLKNSLRYIEIKTCKIMVDYNVYAQKVIPLVSIL